MKIFLVSLWKKNMAHHNDDTCQFIGKGFYWRCLIICFLLLFVCCKKNPDSDNVADKENSTIADSYAVECKCELSSDPLCRACQTGQVEEVKRLIATGENPDKDCEEGKPLCVAACNRQLEVIRALLNAGASLKNGDTTSKCMLFCAIHEGGTNIYKLLMEKGISLNTPNEDGETLLHLSVSFDEPELTAFFLKNGLNPNARDKRGWTPLHECCHNNRPPIHARLLIQAGADVNSLNDRRETPLHLIASHGGEILGLLVKAGAKLNARDREGRTALVYAASDGSPADVKLLLDAGADPRLGGPLECALPYAYRAKPNSSSNQLAKARLLIQYGADPNQRSDDKRTAIFPTVYDDQVDIFRFLVENGANLFLKDDEGLTVFDWVAHYEAKKIDHYIDTLKLKRPALKPWPDCDCGK